MTEQAHDDIDWAEVERRGARQSRRLFGLVPVLFGAMVLLTGRFAFWEGAGAWIAFGGFVVFGLGLQAVGAATPRLRVSRRQASRVEYAVRHHVDPGPELRGRTDVAARNMAAIGWLAWFFPLILVSFFLMGRWDRPLLAVPSALVLVAAVVAYVVWWRRQTAAARRWVEDPPGPDREAPPPTWLERWFTGRGLAWVLLGLLVFAVLSSLVLVRLVR